MIDTASETYHTQNKRFEQRYLKLEIIIDFMVRSISYEDLLINSIDNSYMFCKTRDELSISVRLRSDNTFDDCEISSKVDTAGNGVESISIRRSDISYEIMSGLDRWLADLLFMHHNMNMSEETHNATMESYNKLTQWIDAYDIKDLE